MSVNLQLPILRSVEMAAPNRTLGKAFTKGSLGIFAYPHHDRRALGFARKFSPPGGTYGGIFGDQKQIA